MLDLDLLLRDAATGREVWRERLPVHVYERLIADTHASGVLAGALPNDGAPIRVDGFAVETDDGPARLRVEVGACEASFRKRYSHAVLRDDAEVMVARLLQMKAIEKGTYTFTPASSTAAAPAEGRVRLRPRPRRPGRLPPGSLVERGVRAPRACRHPAFLLPRPEAATLAAQARASRVEVGASLVVETFLIEEPLPCRLGVRVLEAVPLAHGTVGTETHLRIPPQALAAVGALETDTRRQGGLAHSHVLGDKTGPQFLSTEDKAFATGWFWRPHHLQLILDPRFSEPEDAIAAYAWVDAGLVRVCLYLTDC